MEKNSRLAINITVASMNFSLTIMSLNKSGECVYKRLGVKMK
jgi:hypothetical protein